MTERQARSAESYIQAMRTGEGSAARQAARCLAEDVVLITATEQINGRDEVQRRITGQWPMTPVYHRATWSSPVVADHQVTVTATSREVFAPVPKFELFFISTTRA